MPSLPLEELRRVAGAPNAADLLGAPAGGGWIVTDLRGEDGTTVPALGAVAAVLVAVGPPDHPLAPAFDVVVDDEHRVEEVSTAVDAHPTAAASLVLLLRGGDRRSVAEGLVAESATYSALQAGSEHRTWLGTHQRRSRPRLVHPPVRVERDGHRLHLTLDRPEVRNAYDAATRDALLDALSVAAADPGITEVLLDGTGPSFCSGGDLDEFGTLADPATAHLLRVARSVAHALHRLRDRTTVHVHGASVGAGAELPAFAGRVVARADASFRLPEVAMGLVPGAGGTVSLPRRIGRHRTAWMAITGASIDASTALEWGLADELI